MTEIGNTSRRALLRSGALIAAFAAAPAAALSAPATLAAATENLQLLRLDRELTAVAAEHAAADAAYDAAVAEWQTSWPRAPKSICKYWGSDAEIERNILGFAYTAPERKLDGLSQYTYVRSAAELEDDLRDRRGCLRRARAPKTRAAFTQECDRISRQLRAAHAYEAKLARVKQASGIDAAQERRERACTQLGAHVVATLSEAPMTMGGVLLQARAIKAGSVLKFYDRGSLWGVQWGDQLAASMLQVLGEGATA